MTTVWRPTSNAWWIWLLPNLVMTGVGIVLILTALEITSSAPSQIPGLTIREEILLVGVLFVTVTPLFSALLFLSLRRRARSADRLEREGISATARIMDFQPTGTTINNLPEYHFSLHVESADGRAFDTDMKSCVSLLNLHKLEIGRTCRARLDPDGGSGIIVDFGSCAGSSAGQS